MGRAMKVHGEWQVADVVVIEVAASNLMEGRWWLVVWGVGIGDCLACPSPAQAAANSRHPSRFVMVTPLSQHLSTPPKSL